MNIFKTKTEKKKDNLWIKKMSSYLSIGGKKINALVYFLTARWRVNETAFVVKSSSLFSR